MICRPKCKICGGCFDDETRRPLLLPSCGHTCCMACLARFTQHRGYRCSTCGMQQPEKEVSQLQTNHALLALVLELKKEDENKQKKENKVEPENNQETCKTHKGVRLMYWCSPCKKPACGECVVEDHPKNHLHKAEKISGIVEEMSREIHSSITKVMLCIEKFEKDCKEHDTISRNINALSKNIKKIIGKLLISAAILDSHTINITDVDKDIKEMEMMAEDTFLEAPECPTGIKGIHALQAYKWKVHKLQEQVKAKAQVPSRVSDEASQFLDGTKLLSRTLNTHATSLTKQVCGHMMKEVYVEAARGRTAKLQWEDDKLHLYCLSQQNNHSSIRKKPYLKWNVVQSLLKEDETTVFLDLCWGGGKGQASRSMCQKRVYFCVQSGQCSGQQLLELCTGQNTSLLGTHLSSKEEVAGGEGTLLGVHHHEQEEVSDLPIQPTKQPDRTFRSGNIVSMCCEEARETRFWLLTQDGDIGTHLSSAYTFVGDLTIGKVLLTGAASQQNLADIYITNCGAIINA